MSSHWVLRGLWAGGLAALTGLLLSASPARADLATDHALMMEWFEGNPVGIELPPTVELKIVETAPGIKDATASAQRKPAKLESGATVNVPLFIEVGERIKVDRRTNEYLERAN